MDWKQIIGNIAPTIGQALGGPFAGAGVKFLADKLLGKPDATQDQISEFVLGASADDLAKLKGIETEFQKRMAELDVDVFNLEVEDRKSAREAHKDDGFPKFLTVTLTTIMCGILFVLSTSSIPTANSGMLTILLGQISTAWFGSIAYWIGTTKGSADKTWIIGRGK